VTIAQTFRTRTSFVSLKEFAAAVNCHPQTIYKRLRNNPGSIPHIRDGIKIKFDPALLADYIESRCVSAPSNHQAASV
jgi:hypothetical protein